MLPVIFKNLDSSEYLYLPAKTIVTAAKPEGENEVACAKIAKIKMTTEKVEKQCRNWLPRRKPQTDFIVSPADVDEHHKVDILKGQCSKDAEKILNGML